VRSFYDDVLYWEMIYRSLAGGGDVTPAQAPAQPTAPPERG
jgi:hypothetical protein